VSNTVHFRDRVITMLDDARASSSSHPEGSAPEGFGGVIRADAEVTAVLCRQFLSGEIRGGPGDVHEPAQGVVGDTRPPGHFPEPSVTIDDQVLQTLVEQINNLERLSMRWIVWGRLDETETKLVEARVFPCSAPGRGWISLGQLQSILRRGMSW